MQLTYARQVEGVVAVRWAKHSIQALLALCHSHSAQATSARHSESWTQRSPIAREVFHRDLKPSNLLLTTKLPDAVIKACTPPCPLPSCCRRRRWWTLASQTYWIPTTRPLALFGVASTLVSLRLSVCKDYSEAPERVHGARSLGPNALRFHLEHKMQDAACCTTRMPDFKELRAHKARRC